MNQNLLYKFFEGSTSFEEEKKIKNWLERSEANFDILMQRRKEYDIQILSGSKKLSNKRRKNIEIPLTFISGVAAVIIALIIGGIYLFNVGDRTEQFNTILVPAGQRINLILSDNTNLWLNSNTTFRYPTEFSNENRTVYLDGEAYFEVSKDKKKPFIVKTMKGDIHVTGTTFNVEAYSQFDSFETSLFEGGIDIFNDDTKLVSLRPNEISSLKNGELSISNITDTDHYLWKDGLIAFNNQNLEEILLTLEKYFDVDIQITSTNLPQHSYTGKFRQSDGVDYALRVLQKSIRFNYNRDENSRVIFIN